MKERDQIFTIEGTHYLKSQAFGDVLNINNATFVSSSGGDDATVTFAQSGSQDGRESYIKITIGASTTRATTKGGEAAAYYWWDTGFTAAQLPSLCLTMDCSGALESDLVTADNGSDPCVIFGWCFAAGGAAPLLKGNTGRSVAGGGNGTVNTWIAWRMGYGSRVEVNFDADRGDTAFGWGASSANKGTDDGCRGFRCKIIANQYVRADTNAGDTTIEEPIPLYYYSDWHGNTPGTGCPGNKHQAATITSGDDLVASDHLYVFIGAGNTATGGGSNTFAGIFKARIK